MGKKTLALIVLALAIPGAALAAKPSTTPSHSKAAPTVMYVLTGTLSNFTAASTTANGSVTINVTHSNFHARTLVGNSFTFAVSPTTATTLHGNATISKAPGVVKFRALKSMTGTGVMAALTTTTTPMTAFQVIAH
jgi:hypothetical protein